jgi:hypothetical protein
MLSAHRQIKLKARQDLHAGLHDVAFCYLSGGRVFKVVRVRSLTEWGALGDVKGTSLVYAERNDTKKSQIIFQVSEHMPERGDIVMIAADEGWRVDNVEPVYNVTQAANVTRLGAKELLQYKAPPAIAAYSAARGLLPTAAGVTV